MNVSKVIRLIGFVLCLFVFASGTMAQIRLAFTGIPVAVGSGAVGSTYTWPNVGTTNGVTIKATIQVMAITGGAVLQNIDGTGSYGYDEAWQPVINGSTTPAGSCWGIEFMVSFYNAANNAPLALNTFDVSGVDIDGDNTTLREYNSFETPNSYIINNPTTLTSTTGGGFITFQSAQNDISGIDTTRKDLVATVVYNNKSSIRIKAGSCCVGGTCSAGGQFRLHCLYFRNIHFNSQTTVTLAPLPLLISSFSATPQGQNFQLQWQSEDEVNTSHFEIEKSCDGSTFIYVASIPTRGNSSSTTNYNYELKAAGLCEPAYVRLKCVDQNGKYTYSRVIRLSQAANALQSATITYYNGYISIDIPGRQSMPATLSMLDSKGRLVYQNHTQLNAGYNQLLLKNNNQLATGIYAVQIAGTNINATGKIFIDHR